MLNRKLRLHFLAFADDVALFAHSLSDLQRLLSTFEKLALEVGLRINMGKGKTERFYLGPGTPDPEPLYTLATDKDTLSNVVPVTSNYLGMWALDFSDELHSKKGRAWPP